MKLAAAAAVGMPSAATAAAVVGRVDESRGGMNLALLLLCCEKKRVGKYAGQHSYADTSSD